MPLKQIPTTCQKMRLPTLDRIETLAPHHILEIRYIILTKKDVVSLSFLPNPSYTKDMRGHGLLTRQKKEEPLP